MRVSPRVMHHGMCDCPAAAGSDRSNVPRFVLRVMSPALNRPVGSVWPGRRLPTGVRAVSLLI